MAHPSDPRKFAIHSLNIPGENWYHSNYPKEWFVLSHIRGEVVVLMDRIHKELRHTKDIVVMWLS